MERYDSPEIINVGCGEDVTIAELARVDRRRSSAFAARSYSTAASPTARRASCSTSARFARSAGSASTPLADGIRATYDWYLENSKRRAPANAPALQKTLTRAVVPPSHHATSLNVLR